jgi:hypothetical protein
MRGNPWLRYLVMVLVASGVFLQPVLGVIGWAFLNGHVGYMH